MTSLFYHLYPKDATIPDHSVTPAARWAKIKANGGIDPGEEPKEDKDAKAADEEPSESVMSGAMAGLAFLQGASSSAASTSAPSEADSGRGQKRKAESDPPSSAKTAAASADGNGADLAKLSIKELKQRIQAAGLQIPAGAAEKADLVAVLQGKGDDTDEKVFL
eukprot:gb/GFBE01004286.1/.p1 GENE.gb/GFBE01004286.1/~~gb/GFBE01004286.1/.p1  ORF type:complete len:164 (+),score=54.80 gb/GFBE01004286.1/:1-492(+)